MNGLAKVFILLVMRIVTLNSLTTLCVKFFLNAAVTLNLFVCEFDSLKHYVLCNFLHLTLYHHDVLFGSGNHEFKVCLLCLRECRVDNELTVDAGNANLRDRSEERKVAGCKGCRCCKTCECIGLNVFFCRYEPDVNKYCKVEVIREEGAKGTVYKACNKHLIIRGFAFSFHESAGETSGCIEFLFVVYLEGKEISTLCNLCSAGNGGEEHCATHFYYC